MTPLDVWLLFFGLALIWWVLLMATGDGDE